MIHLICGSTGAGKTTYAKKLRQQLGALHLSIDDWMVTLFAPDRPSQGGWPWIEERALRCERQILATALQLGGVGMPSILDLGLQRADQRQRVAGQASAAGILVRLHFLDVDAGERWRRVEARNEQQGETFRVTVTRPMFDSKRSGSRRQRKNCRPWTAFGSQPSATGPCRVSAGRRRP